MSSSSSDGEDIVLSYLDIRPFFSKHEWEELSQYEKMSFQSTKDNYEAMLRAGLAPRKPFFMMSKEEKEGKTVKPPIKRKELKKVASDQGPTRSSRRIHSKYHFDEDDKDDTETILYCDECRKSWMGDCPTHGPLLCIENAKVADKDHERLVRSAPAVLAVRSRGVARSVWTTEAVAERTRFGPYEGDVPSSGGTPTRARSNWMSLVRTLEGREANLRAFEDCGRLFFRTIRRLPAGTELIVRFFNNHTVPAAVGKDSARRTCASCHDDFVSPLLRAQHERASAICAPKIRQQRRSQVERAVRSRGFQTPTPTGPGPSKSRSPASHDARKRQLNEQLRLWRSLRKEQHDLIVHTQNKIDACSYECDDCKEVFSRACRLRVHVETQHLAAPSQAYQHNFPFTCANCEAEFTDIRGLRDHILRTHIGLKRSRDRAT